VLSIKEGVVIGYDRNDKTADAFKKKGFSVIHAADLLDAFERNEMTPDKVENTLILLPSAELSRARGGSHCISMPLWRESLV
jgi:arginine deiminase